MQVTFAGVGAAFDEYHPNTSILIESDDASLLADCGFTAAPAFWRVADDPLSLDGIYISHFHGDHYFGIPHLLLKMVEEGRTAPLKIFGQQGVEKRVTLLMESAYRSMIEFTKFDLIFTECSPGDEIPLKDTRLTFAQNDHPMECLSLRVDSGKHAVFYSGDGRPTDDTQALAKGCDLVVHESYSLEPDTPGHGTVDSSIAFSREAGADTLALVHLAQKIRRTQKGEILKRAVAATGLRIMLPESGDKWHPRNDP